MKNRRLWLGLAVIVIAAVISFLLWRDKDSTGPSVQAKPIRIALTPFPDTSLFLYGKEKGIFRQEKIDLITKDASWNEQIELIVGGNIDVGLGTIDDLVAKTKSLTSINRRVVFAVPVWLFEGTIFVSRGEIESLEELRRRYPEQEARTRFLQQIKGKLIAVPEGGNYDRAIRNFIASAGQNPDDFQFVNTQLETGINGLSDQRVGVAAAGAFERPEALRRGFKVALTSSDLGIVVVTGFLTSEEFYRKNPQAVDDFATAWYRTAAAALADQRGAYDISFKYLNQRGAKLPSYEDFRKALGNNRIPLNSAEAQKMFINEASPFYWRKAWDSAVKNLNETGKGSEAPSTSDVFVADEVLARITQ